MIGVRRTLALALLALPLAGEDFNLGALKWRNIGPNRGGRSIACAGSSKRPLEYYFGATGGGLWKTSDGGLTWAPVTDGQISSSSVGAIAVAESNPDVVYIGMGETELRGNIIQGDGVYRSTDGGKHWTRAGLRDTQAIARIRVHPSNPSLVYVAALGHPFGPNDERGVFRSRDGGKTWQRILFRSNRAGAVDLALDPHNPRVLFAAIWDVYRTPWMLSSGGPASGLFKSTDGGDTWTDITRHPGLPHGIVGKIGITISGADSKRVYAIIEAEDGGVFRSDDAGATWTRVSQDRNLRQRAFYFSRIYAGPKERDQVYVQNVGFWKSTDGGKTFRQLRPQHPDHHDLWIDPENPLRMIESNDGGGNISVNGGSTWSEEAYPTAQLYHVATTTDVPYHVCGAQQDNTTVCVPNDGGLKITEAEGRLPERFYPVAGGEDGYIAPDPKNPDLFYAGSQAGWITRYDRRTGNTRMIDVYPLFFSGMPASALKERWQWTFPIVFSFKDPRVLYTSSQHLWKTTNEGHSWERISLDLTRADPKTLGDSGGPITKDQNGPEIYGTIFTIAPSHHDANTIWTGSDDGLAYLTRDGGTTWQNVTPPALPEFSRISMIDASPHKPGTAYLAANRYQLDDLQAYIFRTDDYGRTWTRIVAGIDASDFVRVVREDVEREGLLFAGTEHGIYVSFDNGARWQSLALNLPDTQVADLVVQRNDLVIATHGRSFYVLDDIGALRQWAPQVSRSEAHLFQPRVVERSLNMGVIDYYLQRPLDQVTIEITDSSGHLVRSFAEKLTHTVGLNRWVWDLRYPGPTVFKGIILRGASPGNGPLAPPGSYQVKLTANGHSQTKPLLVRRDPRLTDVTDEDLRKQFELAIQARDKTSEANLIVIRIRGIKAQLRAKAQAIGADGERLESRLSRIEEAIYQVRNQSPRDTLNYPIKLNNKLAVLAQDVAMGDGPPTEQAYTVFRELSNELAGLATQFGDALASELSRINETLERKHMDKITTGVPQ